VFQEEIQTTLLGEDLESSSTGHPRWGGGVRNSAKNYKKSRRHVEDLRAKDKEGTNKSTIRSRALPNR